MVPLALAVAISFALAWSRAALGNMLDWIVAVGNACLLFCAVVGANETANDVAHPQPGGQGKQQGAKSKRFFQSFFLE